MTDQGKINREGARPASLFERADAAFGLGPVRTPPVPPVPSVPEALRRAPAPQPAPQAPVAPQPVAFAKPEPVAAPAAPQPEAPRAVAFGGPLVHIDREHLRDGGLIVPEDPVTGLLEEFRIVKRELLADARAGASPLARRILVCSPHPGEGKTYCATNLAIALAAERGLEVLLVDADVVKPSVALRLGIDVEQGLMDALADPSIRPESLVIRTDIEGLFVLPAGTATSLDAEYLASARTGEVLDRLTQGAPDRIVIFDTPPALAASPAAELAQHVGQALLVVRADETSRAALEDAQQLLSACGDIKLLLNAARYSPSGRRFGTYGTKGK
ncbi:Mrp family chromosome partitioning ATPase [Erythromicrobium ramosum]|uniref:AAA family ATPase n=1 Tax=Erythrobacter ramosus TaxID=35811 RepID=A0A6I4UJD6_9SPHN|nr:AAA family ATPase [Erythrobacter ramosus]MBB3775918.1 Mrp family chromosome partitioning ATPase [Erythrobacter ramosus]MXP38992.1 AAA family ATPase [Erythrobacter ramosus]